MKAIAKKFLLPSLLHLERLTTELDKLGRSLATPTQLTPKLNVDNNKVDDGKLKLG